MRKKKKEYALYKGDEVLAIGTLDEIANVMEVKKKSIMYYGTPSYEKRGTHRDRRQLIKLDAEA